MQANKGKNLVVELSFSFALAIVQYTQVLYQLKFYVIANQLLKSGTSIGANIREAQNAESRADFIHKFKLAAKETDEVQYWLDLCQFADGFPDCSFLQTQAGVLMRIISKIISTSKTQKPNG